MFRERRLRSLLLRLVLPLFLTACISDREEEGAELQPGDAVPVFSVRMDDGTPLDAHMLSGRISLLVFFHTGCADCRQALPVIQRLYDEANPSLSVYCISREESANAVAAYWLSEGLTLPYSAQEDRAVYRLFARSGIPRIYLVGPDRIIRRVFTDRPPVTYEALREALEAVQAE